MDGDQTPFSDPAFFLLAKHLEREMNHSIFSSPPNPPDQSTEGIKIVPAAVSRNATAKMKPTLFAKQKMDQLWQETRSSSYLQKSSCSASPEVK
ncbi:unnamed protein product [Urochloa humidicola]